MIDAAIAPLANAGPDVMVVEEVEDENVKDVPQPESKEQPVVLDAVLAEPAPEGISPR
jgi:hypothetical protein